MEPIIHTLTIKKFRAFRELRLEGLGQVNLITGKNNTGKSSVLEALRILVSEAAPSVIASILRFREEDMEEPEEAIRVSDLDSSSPLMSLFNGFPLFSADLHSIEIASNGRGRFLELAIKAGWFSIERTPEGSRKMIPQQQDLFGNNEISPALFVNTLGEQRILPLDIWRRRYRPYHFDSAGEPRITCRFVSPYGGERTALLGTLWDKTALTENEHDVLEAMRIIDPAIWGVNMIGGEGARRERTAIVRSSNWPRPVPLRSFGDGLNRLFGIILSLVNAKGGLLLIDEFENGMHHTVQADAWRIIFRLAARLDIQVVATSHSWDAIESFQRVMNEEPGDGVLIRLSRNGEDIIPTLFRKEELAIATRDRIEVR